MAELRTALEETKGNVMTAHPDPLNVLWQNGLLGYDPPRGRSPPQPLLWRGGRGRLPAARPLQSYVFHPIVAHRVWIEPAGRFPVTGFRTHAFTEH